MMGDPVTTADRGVRTSSTFQQRRHHLQFLATSAMKTVICTSDTKKTTQGILPLKNLFFVGGGLGPSSDRRRDSREGGY